MDLELKDAARDAWVYAPPLIEVAVTRDNIVRRGAALNRFYHVTTLADHLARGHHTELQPLYSSAHVDLARGP